MLKKYTKHISALGILFLGALLLNSPSTVSSIPFETNTSLLDLTQNQNSVQVEIRSMSKSIDGQNISLELCYPGSVGNFHYQPQNIGITVDETPIVEFGMTLKEFIFNKPNGKLHFRGKDLESIEMHQAMNQGKPALRCDDLSFMLPPNKSPAKVVIEIDRLQRDLPEIFLCKDFRAEAAIKKLKIEFDCDDSNPNQSPSFKIRNKPTDITDQEALNSIYEAALHPVIGPWRFEIN